MNDEDNHNELDILGHNPRFSNKGQQPLIPFASPFRIQSTRIPAMPSDQSTWLISIPQGSDPRGTFQRLSTKLNQQTKLPPRNVGHFVIPSFKVYIASLYLQNP